MYYQRDSTGSFVEVEQRGPVLIRRWGQIEKAASERIQTLLTVADAQEALWRQADKLERKGYLLGRRNPELLRAMHRSPDEPGAFLVYADWLLERQDARGELILRMSRGQEVQSLLDAHPELMPPPWSARATVQWRLGYVQQLTFRASVWESSSAPFHLRRILRHPSFHFVRELTLEGVPIPRGSLEIWRELLTSRSPLLHTVLLRESPQFTPFVDTIPGVRQHPG